MAEAGEFTEERYMKKMKWFATFFDINRIIVVEN
jgi:hypothetical protein